MLILIVYIKFRPKIKFKIFETKFLYMQNLSTDMEDQKCNILVAFFSI